jgi:hypothetical protein
MESKSDGRAVNDTRVRLLRGGSYQVVLSGYLRPAVPVPIFVDGGPIGAKAHRHRGGGEGRHTSTT